MEEKLESVARYKEALEAVNELKGLQEIRLSLESLEGAQGKHCPPRGGTTSACQRKRFRHTFLRSKFRMCVKDTRMTRGCRTSSDLLSTHHTHTHTPPTHTEGMSDLMGEVDSAREDSHVLKRMSEEAQHWMNKLDEAEQTFQGDDIT